MKSRVLFTCRSTTTEKNGDASVYRYLKPGALARIRDSKITAKSKTALDLQIQMALHQLTASTTTAASTQHPIQTGLDGIPCFSFRTMNPRCLQRKKLIAIAPIFCETQI